MLWRVGEITFEAAESCCETSKPTPTMPSSQQAIRNASSPEEPATHSLVRSVGHVLNYLPDPHTKIPLTRLMPAARQASDAARRATIDQIYEGLRRSLDANKK